MTNIHRDTDKVLASNEGDEFHVVWTARRCLRLLNPLDNLVSVVVEGISPKDTATRGGILKSDTAEYFGADTYETATRFVMSQLKYSPSKGEREKDWSAGGLKDTLQAFAEDFNQKCDEYGEDAVRQKTKYCFVTNRPISSNLLKALDPKSNGKEETKHVENAFNTIQNACGLNDDRFQLFLSLFRFQAREADRPAQEWEFHKELAGYLPGEDSFAPLKLEKLIRSKSLLTGNGEPIRINDVLKAFNIPSTDRLLPSPPSKDYVLPLNYVSRAQEDSIAKTIIAAQKPVLIHAPGGVGKSALALRLPDLMPQGSKSVVFDGFADGLYRQPSTPRHQHSEGLVQIVNELAFRELCDPLLPSETARKSDYIRAFLHRLRQCAETAKRENPEALILIVLDAADNSQQAANDDPTRTPSFGKDLLREEIPENCRLVFLARTERYEELLSPPCETILVQLHPFTIEETSKLLKSFYPDVGDKSVQEFFRMTCQNPRVQFNALKENRSFEGMMKSLGTTPLSVDDTIAAQLEKSLEKIKEEQTAPDQIQRLCTALALLPPLVPIPVLSKAADISEALVHSFVSDFGHYLMIRDKAVHFRDEPVDTWFRQNFSNTDSYTNLIVSLKSMKNSSYASLALPKILWEAGEVDELMKLATSDLGLPEDNSIEKRRIVLRRVQFSLKAAIQKKRYADVVKLSMRAGEEVAGNNREANLLFENHDLVCSLIGAKRAQEVIFRHHIDKWLGASFAYGASMLAHDQDFLGEARHMLRIADGWLSDWAKLDEEDRKEQDVESDDLSALLTAHLLIHGPEVMVNELSRWSPPAFSLRVATDIVKRLVDRGEFELIDNIANASIENPYIVLAASQELSKIGRTTPSKPTHEAIKALLRAEKLQGNDLQWQGDISLEAVIGLIESGARHNIPKRTLIRLINKYIPDIPTHGYEAHYNKDRHIILRFYCLKGALQAKDIQLEQVAPEGLRKRMRASNAEHISDVREFMEVIGTLLPWHKLRQQLIVGDVKDSVLDLIIKAQDSFKNMRTYGGNHGFVANEVAPIWLDILVRSNTETDQTISELLTWMKNKEAFFYYPVRVSMARTIARSKSPSKSYDLINDVYDECMKDRESADSRIETITSTARAILSLDQTEAKAYFEKALEVLNRFGDEIFERWATITALAEKASDDSTPNPELAYTYVRTAEVMSEYIDDHFPWGAVISNASMLCPYSGFSLLSRLFDRDKGWIGEMLPTLAMSLNERSLLSAESCAALASFRHNWPKSEIIRNALENDKDSGKRIFDQFIFDARVLDETGDLEDFVKLASENGIKNQSLDEFYAFYKNTSRKPKDDVHNFGSNNSEKQPEVNWEKIIGDNTFVDANIIDASYSKLKSLRPYWPVKEFCSRMRNCVPRGQEKEHMIGLANSTEMRTGIIISALEECKEDWSSRLSVKEALKLASKELVKAQVHDFSSNRYSINDKFKSLVELSEIDENQLFEALLEGTSECVEDMSANSFFSLAYKSCDFLTIKAAKDAFSYSLERLEPEIDKEDGDGEWNESLKPPESIDQTLAGFLFITLAHPKAEIRWQATHAVLRLCRLEQRHVISYLIGFLEKPEMNSFIDKKLPFYLWNAKLYLMIALARAAKENASNLTDYKNTFLRLAFDKPKHALIRHFSAEALLSIQETFPETLSLDEIESLKNINTSSFAIVDKEVANDEENTNIDESEEIEELDYLLPHDFDTGWLSPLSNIFAIPFDHAKNQIKKWALKEGKGKYKGKWVDDPRGKNRYYHDLNTQCRYGENPEADTISFYLSYHGIMCLAADLIDTRPIFKTDSWGTNWHEWLSRRLLTRKDGYWLFDRRDPQPLEQRRWEREPLPQEQYQEWKWCVLPEDFDEALINVDQNKLNLHGYWNVDNSSHKENLSIRSAVISPETSIYLLRALQTEESPHDFFIPNSGHDAEFEKFGFKMRGWISDSHSDLRLDEHDHLSGKTPWPCLKPSNRTCRILGLKPSLDKRFWLYEDQEVIQSESWGDRREKRHFPARNYGQRLSVDKDFAIASLQKLHADMIIEVTIEREHEKEEDYIRYDQKNYNRIYLLKRNGELCTLYGSSFIWKENSKRTKAFGGG